MQTPPNDGKGKVRKRSGQFQYTHLPTPTQKQNTCLKRLIKADMP